MIITREITQYSDFGAHIFIKKELYSIREIEKMLNPFLLYRNRLI